MDLWQRWPITKRLKNVNVVVLYTLFRRTRDKLKHFTEELEDCFTIRTIFFYFILIKERKKKKSQLPGALTTIIFKQERNEQFLFQGYSFLELK